MRISAPSLAAVRFGPLVVALLLAAGGCRGRGDAGRSGSRAQSRGTPVLRVYNFANYFGRTTVSSFEEKIGAKVVVESYQTNEEMLHALRRGKSCDVVFPSSYAVERLLQEGRLRRMDRDRVPNLLQVPERFRNPPVDPSLQHCIPYTWSMTGIGLLSPRQQVGQDPDSLAVLFGERGARVAMIDDMRATLGVALRYLGFSASTRQPEEIARARDLLLSQSSRVLAYVNDVGPMLSRGQVGLALAWSGDVLEVVRRNPDVRFVVPKEGTLLYVDYACVPEKAHNPDLAFAFLNHLLDPGVAAEITNGQLWATPNLGAQKMLQPEARWLWGILDAVKDQGRFEMLRDVGPAVAHYEAAWKAVKARVSTQRTPKSAPR